MNTLAVYILQFGLFLYTLTSYLRLFTKNVVNFCPNINQSTFGRSKWNYPCLDPLYFYVDLG